MVDRAVEDFLASVKHRPEGAELARYVRGLEAEVRRLQGLLDRAHGVPRVVARKQRLHWSKRPPVAEGFVRIPDDPVTNRRMVRCLRCGREMSSLGTAAHMAGGKCVSVDN